MMSLRHLVVIAAALAPSSVHATATVRDLGRTVALGSANYYLPGEPEVVIPTTNHPFRKPENNAVSLLPVTHAVQTADLSVQQVLEHYGQVDDVWTSDFESFILVSGATSKKPLAGNTIPLSKSSPLSEVESLPPGPYFAQVTDSAVSFFRAYRVYADPARAFYYGVLQQSNYAFEVLSSTSPLTNGGATIAVPSRLYYPAPNKQKPLSGVRVGVKDLYNLKGLKTGAGNRAYFSFNPAADDTAESIQHLISLGAVVVGKTRTSQFANGETPTADWVDYHDPFNARGDGYQDPSSSSAGAAAAQSNYDWIDMNIGSDTGGSIRAPAAVNGVFGNRPTQDIMSLNGVVSMSPSMDTPAFVSRSAADFALWGKAWYSAGNVSLKSYTGFPHKLIYPIDTPGIDTTEYPSPGFFPASNEHAQALYSNFTQQLENFLNTTKTVFDFYTEYKNHTGAYPLDSLGAVWGLMTSFEQFSNVVSPFISAYKEANGGDHPYLDPQVALNMDLAQNTTNATFAEAVANKTTFKNWIDNSVLIPRPDAAECSSALLIHPIWPGEPSYRDTYPTESPEEAGVSFVWNQYGISQLAGVPEVVIPLGQVNYTSRVTHTTKQLPVSVSINAAAGCDLMLYDLVEVLANKSIIPSKVLTGQSIL
ncbi:Glutamyl-tRNA(Gln) amidotransferase subunit A, mitochondrial [Talaromyces islandicus]|uniref:Glutamyl-tRNA(Gln) amidotransferase subunit A, mitochondrial n=1 Tax=Talaromyces islandicus TaxID=28573 RepID=A0A0U1M7S6_TALIS|nr:Glutamyl-tRNA(Gln) amidotransferase subunit A, mitochondrial [Talaromyces islandicus]